MICQKDSVFLRDSAVPCFAKSKAYFFLSSTCIVQIFCPARVAADALPKSYLLVKEVVAKQKVDMYMSVNWLEWSVLCVSQTGACKQSIFCRKE